MTSDILSMGVLWGSSGDVYNGGFFFKDMVFWIVYFLAKCDRDWVLFKIRTMPIYLLSEFLFADGEATYGMRCASYHTEKSMREDRGFLFHFFFSC